VRSALEMDKYNTIQMPQYMYIVDRCRMKWKTKGGINTHLLRSHIMQVQSWLALTRMLNGWQMLRQEIAARWPNN